MASSTLPPLISVSGLVSLYGVRARSQLGQNFLFDANVTDKIARCVGDLRDTAVIEVGPGPGGLTRSLLRAGAPLVVAVEMDRRFMPVLQQLATAVPGRLDLVMGDILAVPASSLLGRLRAYEETHGRRLTRCALVGNLPFNVATTLLLQWLRDLAPPRRGLFAADPKERTVDMTLMFQTEVAQRIVAAPGTAPRGRLSVMAQHLCEVRSLYEVPSTAFVPPPKVTGTVVQLRPLAAPLPVGSIAVLEDVLKTLFANRRKTLARSLRPHLPLVDVAKELPALGLDPQARPEVLTNEQWSRLADFCQQQGWATPPEPSRSSVHDV